MLSSSIFSWPVPAYHQPKVSLKDGPLARKRKRSPIDDNGQSKRIDASRIDPLQQVSSGQPSPCSEYTAVLTPEERSQYRVAGHAFDQILPRNPFPHASQPAPDDSSKKIQRTSSRLARLDPPIYVPSPNPRTLPLHQKHLAAVTALLHRVLAEGDFARAGRALSLILRDRIGGQGLDVRAEGRWGIGAEVLLRQARQTDYTKVKLNSERRNDRDRLNQFEGLPPTGFSSNGFDDARKYYERLIIQYPSHRPSPGAINALDFYPAMFGLWIYVVQQESKLNEEAPGDYTSGERTRGGASASTDTRPASYLASRQRRLEQVREIAGRMDNCMTVIPFSDDVELIRLRGMVASWMADLIDDLLENQDALSDDKDDDVEADVVASVHVSRSRAQGSDDDPHEALTLESDRAKQKALEMQRKSQRISTPT